MASAKKRVLMASAPAIEPGVRHLRGPLRVRGFVCRGCDIERTGNLVVFVFPFFSGEFLDPGG